MHAPGLECIGPATAAALDWSTISKALSRMTRSLSFLRLWPLGQHQTASS